MVGTIIGAGIQAGLGAINNAWAKSQQDEARAENYRFGEMAAENADARTRALYNDLYSPSALLEQYKKAGLSPSLMFGGTPGQGGMSGAQGTGASGLGTPYMPMSLIEGAQIANLKAQTEKTKAETENVKNDTALKDLELKIKELETGTIKQEWEILNTHFERPDGTSFSLFELADNYYSYEGFLEEVRKVMPGYLTDNETGQQLLRTIYTSASKFNRDIAVLSEEQVSANFELAITQKLTEKDFVNLNAEAAVAQLKQTISTSELTETQKEAWNNLINRLGKKGSTTRDILVVLGMIVGNFASHTGIKINVGRK